jgi:hypothetical protein
MSATRRYSGRECWNSQDPWRRANCKLSGGSYRLWKLRKKENSEFRMWWSGLTAYPQLRAASSAWVLIGIEQQSTKLDVPQDVSVGIYP